MREGRPFESTTAPATSPSAAAAEAAPKRKRGPETLAAVTWRKRSSTKWYCRAASPKEAATMPQRSAGPKGA